MPTRRRQIATDVKHRTIWRSGVALWMLVASTAQAHGPVYPDAIAPPPWKAPFMQVFVRADQDSDGRLSMSEVGARAPRLSAVFESIDLDGNGYLDYPEYLAYLRDRYRGISPVHSVHREVVR